MELDDPLLTENSDQSELTFFPNENSDAIKSRQDGKSVFSLLDRIQAGSVKGSMFTLTTAVVGAGVLAVPYAIRMVGYVYGLILFWLGGLMAYFSLHILVLSSGISKTSNSYKELAQEAIGPKFAILTQVFICLNLFGTSVGYLVGGAELIDLAVSAISSHVFNRTILLCILACTIVLPISLFRNLTALRFSSLFAILCILYLNIIVIWKYFQYLHLGYVERTPLTVANFNISRLLSALPLVVFAYTCHPNVLPIYFQLQRASPKRMNKVMRRSIYIAASMYSVTGLFVYMTFKENTKSNFLRNDYHHDPSVIIGCLAFCMAIIITIPLFIHTLRKNINMMIFGKLTHLSTGRHCIFTIALVGFTLLIAITTSDVASVLSILGATSNPIICFVLPTVFLWKLAARNEFVAMKRLALLMTLLISISSTLSLLQQIGICNFV